MKRILSALLITLLCFPLASCGEKPYSRSEVVLGEAIVLGVTASGANAKKATDEMFALAEEVFADMNVTDTGSALSNFNKGGSGAETEIDKHIYNVLRLADTAFAATDGAFDVTSLPLSELWKVDAVGIKGIRPDIFDLKATAVETLPDIEEVRKTLEYVGMDKIDFFERDGKYYITKTDARTKIDLGGIAKGYFADLAKDIAEKHGLKSCLINLSGNLYLYGSAFGGGDWKIGVVNPRPRLTLSESMRTHAAVVTSGGNCSFVTSGDYQRFYYASYEGDGLKSEAQLIPVCHIIDPRNGLPVGVKYNAQSGRYETDFDAVCSATVGGTSSSLCDAYSTAVCVLGLEKGAKLLEENGLAGLVFTSPDESYDPALDNAEGGITPTRKGKGKLAVVGQWNFIDGSTVYKDDYERAA